MRNINAAVYDGGNGGLRHRRRGIASFRLARLVASRLIHEVLIIAALALVISRGCDKPRLAAFPMAAWPFGRPL